MVLLAALLFGGCSTGLGGDAAGGRSDGGSGEASGTTVLSPRPSGPTTTVLVEDDPLVTGDAVADLLADSPRGPQ